MRFWLTAAFLILAAHSSARATEGIECEIDDKGLKGTLGAVQGSLPGLSQIAGEFEILAKGVPADFRKVKLTGENLPHSWFHGRDLKLQAYKEREKGLFASFELVIETRAAGEDSYRGGYELRISFMPDERASENKTITLKGKAVCSAG